MEEKDASGAEWNPAPGTMDSWDGFPTEDSDEIQKLVGLPRAGGSNPDGPSTDLPPGKSEMRVSRSSSTALRVIPESDSPTHSAQLPSTPPFRYNSHLLCPLLRRTALHLGPP